MLRPNQKKIQLGETYYSIMKKFGFTDTQFQNILRDSNFPRNIALTPGQKYLMAKTKTKLQLKFYNLQTDQSYTFWKKTTGPSGLIVQVENFDVEKKTVKGKIRGSIIESLGQKGIDKHLAYRFVDAYRPFCDLKKDVKKNALYSLTYEKKFDSGVFIKSGEVLKAKLEVKGIMNPLFFIKFQGGGSFIHADIDQKARQFYSPVEKIKISSVFNPRRFHPIKRRRQPHMGVDLELPLGEFVFSTLGGTVEKVGRNRAAGNYVVIDHHNGYKSYYNHLGFTEAHIKKNTKVKTGEIIARIGCSGYCTKAHLHFAIKKNGKYKNPIKLIKTYPFVYEEGIKRARKTVFSKENSLKSSSTVL